FRAVVAELRRRYATSRRSDATRLLHERAVADLDLRDRRRGEHRPGALRHERRSARGPVVAARYDATAPSEREGADEETSWHRGACGEGDAHDPAVPDGARRACSPSGERRVQFRRDRPLGEAAAARRARDLAAL